MAAVLLPDELWEIAAPLLPPEPPKPKGGRPRIPDRQCLTGILFVLRSGIAWELLPQEMGCGSGMTCWRRLRDWTEADVWPRLQEALLTRLRERDLLDWDRAAMDAALTPAKKARTAKRAVAAPRDAVGMLPGRDGSATHGVGRPVASPTARAAASTP